MFTNSISKISVLLLVLVIAFVTVSFATHPAAVSSADRSYDSLEQARTTRPMAHIFGATYDQIESLRVLRNRPNPNASYDALEQVRNERGLSADRSYDSLERVRASNSVSFPASVSSYDIVEALRLTRGTKDAYSQLEALRLGR